MCAYRVKTEYIHISYHAAKGGIQQDEQSLASSKLNFTKPFNTADITWLFGGFFWGGGGG